MTADNSLPLALTLGNPSGIGPEIALKAWLARKQLRRPFFLLGDPAQLAGMAMNLGLNVPLYVGEPEEASAVFDRALPVVRLANSFVGRPGISHPGDAVGTIEAIERAVQLVHAGKAGGVVTNPIAKAALYASGFVHPGHTEYLGALASSIFGVAAMPVMMIWSPVLAVVPVTIHVALAQVPALLSQKLIFETALTTIRDLTSRFGIARPRIAITGLNPHAGENGSMGREEIDIIGPAIEQLQALGLAVTGPHPADTLFHAAARGNYDAVLGMYHDQVLVPAKTLAFDDGVNITLGLPFIRTSPDHGTAFDIAGKGIANASSLIAALNLAARLA